MKSGKNKKETERKRKDERKGDWKWKGDGKRERKSWKRGKLRERKWNRPSLLAIFVLDPRKDRIRCPFHPLPSLPRPSTLPSGLLSDRKPRPYPFYQGIKRGKKCVCERERERDAERKEWSERESNEVGE